MWAESNRRSPEREIAILQRTPLADTLSVSICVIKGTRFPGRRAVAEVSWSNSRRSFDALTVKAGITAIIVKARRPFCSIFKNEFYGKRPPSCPFF